MKFRGYPLLLEFPIYEGNGEPIIVPTRFRAQQASSLKPRLPRDGRVKYFPIS
jgi:hypothetical protein